MTARYPAGQIWIGPGPPLKLAPPVPPGSLISTSSDFVANKGLPMQLLLQKVTCSVYPKAAKLDAAIVVAEALPPYKIILNSLNACVTKGDRPEHRATR